MLLVADQPSIPRTFGLLLQPVLMVVGAGAVLPAARRAARTDPLIALRSE
jgi:hypothetical protein